MMNFTKHTHDVVFLFYLAEQMGNTHTVETEEAMDIEAGQFEDAEEDP